MPLLPRDAGAPAAAPMARATEGAFPTDVIYPGRAMSQSREAVQPVCAKGSGGARSRGGAGPRKSRQEARVEELRIAETDLLPLIPNRLKKGYAAWFINAANSSSPFWLSPGTAQSCAPYYRHGFCTLRDRRGAGRPQCLEPAVLRSDCGEKVSRRSWTSCWSLHCAIAGCLSRPQCGASLASRNDQAQIAGMADA